MRIIRADNNTEYVFLKSLRSSALEQDGNIIKTVTDILSRVRCEGDKALIEYTKKFDGASSIKKYSARDFEEAYCNADKNFVKALLGAAARIRAFHKKQITTGYEIQNGDAVTGQLIRGIDKVGIYVPGGTAAYPSSVLMNAIPAKLSGVGRIIMISPPGKSGEANPDILIAAHIAEVDELILVGGAQGIAALTYGTESVPKVDKIVGPGNVYVAAAKRLVYGAVDIDMVAGPSEIMIIADENANPDYVAADLLSQAEHDTLASAVLLTTSETLAEKTAHALENRLAALPRFNIARSAIDNYGGIIICDNTERMFELSNDAAPEHLEILLDNPKSYLDKVKNAGSVFLGEYSPEPLGDYFAGTNHVLPTSGTARFSSPLSVDSFIKKTQYIYYTREELIKVGSDIMMIAEKEGLKAHAESIKARLK